MSRERTPSDGANAHSIEVPAPGAAGAHSVELAVPGAALGALLTGGKSQRMGRDKATLELRGRTLAERCAATLSRVAAEIVQIGATPVDGLDVEHLQDLRPDTGPAAGIETALVHARDRAVIALAVDVPLVPARLLRAVLAMVADGAPIAAPRTAGGWHPLCAAYAAESLTALRPRLDAGAFGLQSMLEEIAVPLEGRALANLGDPEEMLLNLNRPGDLSRAAEILASLEDDPTG